MFLTSSFLSKGIHVAHLNCSSLLKHLDELRLVFCKCNPHDFSLNKTRLCKNITDAEVAFLGYCILRSDRNRKGGGVLLAVKII